MTRHKYSGCIIKKPVSEYSYKGHYRDVRNKTLEQNIEISEEHADLFIKRAHLIPICTEHDITKIGEVTRAYRRDDGSVWVDFDLDDESTAGTTAHTLVQKGILKHLSLNHDWNDLQPVEVSLTFKPARPGTIIETNNNSTEYILPQQSEGVTTSYNTPCMMSANAESVNSVSAPVATNPTTPAVTTSTPVTDTPAVSAPAAAAASGRTPFDSYVEAHPALNNLPEHHKKRLQSILNTNIHTDTERESLIEGVLDAVVKEREYEAKLKEIDNENRKLKEERESLKKDKTAGKQQFHTLIEHFIKEYRPDLVNDKFTEEGKKLAGEDMERYVDFMQPTMVACSLARTEKLSQRQMVKSQKLEALAELMGEQNQKINNTPNMVSANLSSVSGMGKRSHNEMSAPSTTSSSAGGNTWVNRVPFVNQSNSVRDLLSKLDAKDYGMDITAYDVASRNYKHLLARNE